MSLNYCPAASSSRCPPPSYSPSTASPSYAAEPSPDEERLDFVAHPQAPPSTGVFTKKTRSLTVSLNHQEHGATIPSYARHAVVSGEVHLEKRDSVQAVTVKVRASPSSAAYTSFNTPIARGPAASLDRRGWRLLPRLVQLQARAVVQELVQPMSAHRSFRRALPHHIRDQGWQGLRAPIL